MWNKDEIKGKAERLKGRMKQESGDVLNDESLVDEGVADEAAGTVQETWGKGKRKIGEAIEDVGKRVKR
jgi:uncharacterized protein YjbJ (UPF0337 family)